MRHIVFRVGIKHDKKEIDAIIYKSVKKIWQDSYAAIFPIKYYFKEKTVMGLEKTRLISFVLCEKQKDPFQK